MWQQLLEQKFGPTHVPERVHTVTTTDFLRRLDSPTQFDWKSNISRASYMNWLKNSFKLSFGSVEAQLAICEWSRIHLGFLYMDAFDSFDEIKNSPTNFDFLLPEEKSDFCNDFRRVKNHIHGYPKYETIRSIPDEKILWDISSQTIALSELIEYEQLSQSSVLEIQRLAQLNQSQFRKEITQYAMQNRR